MPIQTPITGFQCPGCRTVLAADTGQTVRCPSCRWKGQVHLFEPLTVEVERPEAALPDDAVCAHHPTKRAVAVCAGTGDYICALCSVEIGEQTYSAQFISTHGKKKLEKAFARHLPRPDSLVVLMLILMVFPYCFFLWPLWAVIGVVYMFKAHALRRTDPLYKQLTDSGRLPTLWIGLGLLTMLWMLGSGLLLLAIVTSRH